MKKRLIVLLVLCIFFLCACNSEQTIDGQVIETSFNPDTKSTQFVILTNEGKEIGIVMDTETSVMTWVDGVDVDNFKSGEVVDVMVTAKYDRSSSSLTTGDGKDIKSYTAHDIRITAFLTRDALKLADGKSIDIWSHSGRTVYQLNDGTELLDIRDPFGPNNVYVGGIESFDDLDESAQSNVLSYYANQGLLYDVDIELERAYTNYKYTENKSDFSSLFLSQDIAPTSSNEKVMYFLTSITLPIVGNHGYEMRLGAAFNREEGKHISNWELFACSEEEAKQAILDIAGISDLVLRAEMEAAFKPEYIILFTDNLEVSFPVETLPSQEHGYILVLDFDDDLSKILNEWAIPKRTE